MYHVTNGIEISQVLLRVCVVDAAFPGASGTTGLAIIFEEMVVKDVLDGDFLGLAVGWRLFELFELFEWGILSLRF